MKRQVKISYKPFDKENIIVFFERDGKDIGFEFALCEFVNEMYHWNMPTQIGDLNGKKGYIFSKSIPQENIGMEIIRFIKHNGLKEGLV